MNSFICGRKPEKNKHNTLIGKYEWGGLKMVDVKSMHESLCIAWTAWLWDEREWSNVINLQISKYGGIKLLIRCNYNYKMIDLPIFYQNILKYSDYVFNKKDSRYILWNNRDIMINRSTIFYQNWYDKGVLFIQDLMSSNGNWMTYNEFSSKCVMQQNSMFQYMGVINCLKELIKGNKDYADLNPNLKPNIKISSPIFQTIDQNRIDVRKSK